jgi:DNA-directed RNA polymerase specialized sigma24 family protein
VTLYHLEEMAVGEIAAVMDLPEGTVKSHLFRARKLLKEKLVASYGPEGMG